MKKLGIIGAGPGGYVAAVYAARNGFKVTLFEKRHLGGECTNWGCIPTKTFYSYAHLLHKLEDGKKRKIFDEVPQVNYRRVVNRKDMVVKRLRSGINYLLKNADVELINSEAVLVDKNTIRTIPDHEDYNFDYILLATGSDPAIPPVPGLEGSAPWTNRETLDSNSMPENILILGAGVIGVEFAGIFNQFGANVTLCEIMPGILTGLDGKLRETEHKCLTKKGVKVMTNTFIEKVERDSDGIVVTISEEEKRFDEIIVAAGRIPLAPLENDNTGIELDKRGHVIVDDYLKTTLDNVYAIGDLTGAPYLAHRASAQAEIAIDNMLGKKRTEPKFYPTAIFGPTELGTVGMTEDQAREEFGDDIKIGEFFYIASGRAQAEDSPEGFVKYIANPSGEIVGIHIAGASASEMIAAATIIFEKKLGEKDLEEIVFAHPTLGEMLKEAGLDLFGKAIHK